MKFYSSNEVVQMLNISKPTLYAYVRNGNINASIKAKRGKQFFFTMEDIKKLKRPPRGINAHAPKEATNG